MHIAGNLPGKDKKLLWHQKREIIGCTGGKLYFG